LPFGAVLGLGQLMRFGGFRFTPSAANASSHDLGSAVPEQSVHQLTLLSAGEKLETWNLWVRVRSHGVAAAADALRRLSVAGGGMDSQGAVSSSARRVGDQARLGSSETGPCRDAAQQAGTGSCRFAGPCARDRQCSSLAITATLGGSVRLGRQWCGRARAWYLVAVSRRAGVVRLWRREAVDGTRVGRGSELTDGRA
jgi:hypothetical protein